MQESRFRAMGTDCHVIVESGDADHEHALLTLTSSRVELLEQSWSRFRPSSELSRLNGRAGTGPVPVSADLLLLGQRMKQAWQLTDGLFDPTVLTSMTTLGYDTDFASITAVTVPAITDITLLPAPGMGAVHIDPDASIISLPIGVGLDPGAIGKGLAADVIVGELRDAGADAVLVNLGGDISIAGRLGEPWCVEIIDERTPRDSSTRTLEMLTFDPQIDRVGIATSTTLKRRWAQGRHHVIDPRTGAPAAEALVQVTVVDEMAWRAEVLATAALLHDDANAWLDDHDAAALLVSANTVHRTSAFAAPRKEHAHG